MGKGDKRTRRGKIILGSFGNTRPRATKVSKTPAKPKPVAAPAPTARPRAGSKRG